MQNLRASLQCYTFFASSSYRSRSTTTSDFEIFSLCFEQLAKSKETGEQNTVVVLADDAYYLVYCAYQVE